MPKAKYYYGMGIDDAAGMFAVSASFTADDHAGSRVFRRGEPANARFYYTGGSSKAICFLPDSRRLVASRGGHHVLDIASGNCEAKLTDDSVWGPRRMGSLCSAVSPDGKWLLADFKEGENGLWRIETWQRVALLEGHWDEVTAVAFFPDGKRFVTGGADGTLVIWDLAAVLKGAVIQSGVR